MDFISKKVKNIKPSIFEDFNQKKRKLKEKGVNVIDLGIGAPDKPAPEFVVEELYKEAKIASNHRYSSFDGCYEYRKAVSDFYAREYEVNLDPDTEVLTLVGSKEGIFNMVQAVVDPGDNVMVPNPGYPTYRAAVNLAGANVVDLPLDKEKNYEPQLEKISGKEAKGIKLMLTNYPNNPTTSVVGIDVYEKVIEFAKENHVLVANDTAYNLVTFDGYKSPSILQVDGGKDFSVEFGSLSKSYNMTGWRIGYVVGNKEVLRAIKTIKSNMDSGQFLAIQKAAAYALKNGDDFVNKNNHLVQKRMEMMYSALTELGFDVKKSKGTIFLWIKTPDRYNSIEFADKLLEETGVIVTPGTAFGQYGEGFFRIALTVELDVLEEVVRRIRKMMAKE